MGNRRRRNTEHNSFSNTFHAASVEPMPRPDFILSVVVVVVGLWDSVSAADLVIDCMCTLLLSLLLLLLLLSLSLSLSLLLLSLLLLLLLLLLYTAADNPGARTPLKQ